MPYPQGERLREKFDPAIIIGGFALSFLAGFVNGSMLEVLNVPVSHMSGAVSRFGSDLAYHRFVDLKFISLIVAFFVLGSATSGAVIGSQRLHTGKPYGVVIMLESISLFVAYLLFRQGNNWSLAFAALGCGMQNAMASRYYGMIIRTTHVTGVVTDIGFMLGAFLRHRTLNAWRLLLLAQILLGFFLGGYLAVVCLDAWQGIGLFVASTSCFAVGAFYFTWQHYLAKSSGDPANHP